MAVEPCNREPLGQCRGEGLRGMLCREARVHRVAAGTYQGLRWEGTAMTLLQAWMTALALHTALHVIVVSLMLLSAPCCWLSSRLQLAVFTLCPSIS